MCTESDIPEFEFVRSVFCRNPTPPIMVSVEHFMEVAVTLTGYRAEGFLCDTILELNDKALMAHSILLSAVSPVFRAAFVAISKPGIHRIKLPDVDSEIMEIALTFIYTGKLVLPRRYKDPSELPKLVSQLKRLGVAPERLNGCEMTFMR